MRTPENTHKMGSQREYQRPQNEPKRRGGQPRNMNAKKRLVWLPSYSLETPENIRAFLREVIKRTWTGELGSRQASAINSTVSILLEHPGSMPSPVEIGQADFLASVVATMPATLGREVEAFLRSKEKEAERRETHDTHGE